MHIYGDMLESVAQSVIYACRSSLVHIDVAGRLVAETLTFVRADRRRQPSGLPANVMIKKRLLPAGSRVN
jgi:hypothetical protein